MKDLIDRKASVLFGNSCLNLFARYRRRRLHRPIIYKTIIILGFTIPSIQTLGLHKRQVYNSIRCVVRGTIKQSPMLAKTRLPSAETEVRSRHRWATTTRRKYEQPPSSHPQVWTTETLKQWICTSVWIIAYHIQEKAIFAFESVVPTNVSEAYNDWQAESHGCRGWNQYLHSAASAFAGIVLSTETVYQQEKEILTAWISPQVIHDFWLTILFIRDAP